MQRGVTKAGATQRQAAQEETTKAESSPALRLGFCMLGGLRRSDAEAIVQARARGRYRSIEELTVRTGLGQSTIVRLSEADAFSSLGLDRRGALWNALAQEARPRELPLFEQSTFDQATFDQSTDEQEFCEMLPRLEAEEEVYADYRTTGLSLRAHPISFYREPLAELRVTPNGELKSRPADRPVRVAGLVLLRQRPSTAKGIAFVTLEDETGTANLVIRPQIWERYYRVAKTAAALIAHGKLERKHGVIHVVVNKLEDMKGRIGAIGSQSRDFR